MNILLFRELPGATVTSLRGEFPQCTFLVMPDATGFEPRLAWPDIVFGNAPAALLQRAPRLRWLQIVSSGFDEYSALAGSPVIVTTAHGVHAPIIAQHVLLMFLTFVRDQPHFAACQRAKTWDRRPALPKNCASQTLGLVGYGNVGREVARLFRALGVRIVATKRTTAPTPPELVQLYPWSELDAMLAICDHVVITVPLTPETNGLFTGERLNQIKPGAVLHNIARGGLVDEGALIDRLRSGHLAGAALDVFEHEPLPPESPLWEHPNVIVTPHLAGHHRELGALVLERFVENLRRFLRGEPLQHMADFARGY